MRDYLQAGIAKWMKISDESANEPVLSSDITLLARMF
jgi:hypothetical protein